MNKIPSDILFGIATRVAIRFRGLIFIPLISINLGVAAFGAYTQILAIATLLELVLILGFHQSLIHFGQRSDDITDLYFSLLATVVFISAVAAGAFFLVASPLAKLTLGTASYTPVYRLGAFLLVTKVIIRMGRNYFRIDSRIKIYSVIQAVKVYTLLAVISAGVIFFDSTLADILLFSVIVEAGTGIALHGQIVREIGITVPSFNNLEKHLRYSIPMTLSTLAGVASSRVDRIIIGSFLGASAVGLYSMAYQICVAILVYVNPIRETFFPEFSSLFCDDNLTKCGQYMQQGIRYFLLIAIPSAGGLYLIGSDVIVLLTAGSGTPSPMLVLLLALGMTANGLNRISGVVLRAAEETDTQAIYNWVSATLNVVLNVVTIPLLGINGAAIATLLTYLLVAGLILRRAMTLIPMRLPIWNAVRASGATALMVLAATVVGTDRLVTTVVLSVVIYALVLLLTREITVDELKAAL